MTDRRTFCNKFIIKIFEIDVFFFLSGSVRSSSVVLVAKSGVDTVLAKKCGTDSWLNVTGIYDHDSIKILHLSPYTCYQFSILHCHLQSPPSQQINTLPFGKMSSLIFKNLFLIHHYFFLGDPGTPPKIISVRQLPRLNINITFETPNEPNGKM